MAWQLCRALFTLGIGLYMARHFMTNSSISGCILRGATILMLLGGLANVLVVIVNRGMMPVRIDQVLGKKRFSHEPAHSGTRLWYLGDCIRIGGWYLSPGDICLYSGCILILGGLVLPRLIP